MHKKNYAFICLNVKLFKFFKMTLCLQKYDFILFLFLILVYI